MSRIFDFFGAVQPITQQPIDMPEANGTVRKPILQLGRPGSTPAKVFGSARGKPKGLSLRSDSELNVKSTMSCGTTGLTEQKSLEFLKPRTTQIDTSGRPISPRSKDRMAKGKSLKHHPGDLLSISPKSHKLIPTRSSPTFKLAQDHVFKKPFTPPPVHQYDERFYLEPEKLANYYDETEHYLNAYDTDLKSECDELLAAMLQSNESHEDEGFESDPEMLPCPTLSSLRINTPDSEERSNKFTDNSFVLPEISDDEF